LSRITKLNDGLWYADETMINRNKAGSNQHGAGTHASAIPNSRPTAVIVAPAAAGRGAVIDLDGRTSTDPESDRLYGVRWNVSPLVVGGTWVDITSNRGLTAKYKLPNVRGRYSFQFIVQDECKELKNHRPPQDTYTSLPAAVVTVNVP